MFNVKWKTTSKKIKNGKRPQKNNGQQPRKEEKVEDDQNKIFSQFLLNLGANLSWVWLSSLRFYY
jgi:hypothetical protein